MMSTPALFLFEAPTVAGGEPVYHFNSYINPDKVDRGRGVVRDVTVITAGVEAAGHNLHTDQTTLTQMERCGQALGQVPVKWNHKTGADAVCGFITNFRREGNKLLGDWHLLKNHERYNQALELAERMPSCVGLSAAFKGSPEAGKGGHRFARCREMLAVDLVAHPAANPDGLFEAVDSPAEVIMDSDNPSPADQTTLLSQITDLLDERLTPLAERLDQLEEFNSAVTEQLTHFDEDGDEEGAVADAWAADYDEGDGDYEDNASAETAAFGRDDIINEVIGYFAAQQEEADEVTAFEDLQAKVAELTEFAATAKAENDALRTAMEGGGKAVSGGGEATMFSVLDGGGGADGVTEFEQRVKALTQEGKRPGEATQFAMKENPVAYKEHLRSKGVLAG